MMRYLRGIGLLAVTLLAVSQAGGGAIDAKAILSALASCGRLGLGARFLPPVPEQSGSQLATAHPLQIC